MKLGQIIGTVVAERKHEALRGHRLLVVQPVNAAGARLGAPLVALDRAQAGVGDVVFYTVQREAGDAFGVPNFTPIDATVLGIVDGLPGGGGGP